MHIRQKSELLPIDIEIERTLRNLKKVRVVKKKKTSYCRARKD